MRSGSPARLLALGAAAAAAGCAEPAIEMRLEVPSSAQAAGFDVSCLGAVEVIVRGTYRGRPSSGTNDDGQPADDLDDCIEISDVRSYAEVRREIAGRFSLALPESGLAGVDVRGSTGTCKKDNGPGDPIFYASAPYEGGDEVVLPMVPNLSCANKRRQIVRPLDLLALTRTSKCPTVPLVNGAGTVYGGTIHPAALAESVFDLGDGFGSIMNGVASVELYRDTGEPSCIALDYIDDADAMTSTSCARRGLGVCTPNIPNVENEIELPIIDYGLADQALDRDTLDEYGGAVIGGIWGTTTTDPASPRIQLTGAKVQTAQPTDADQVKIVYAGYTDADTVPDVLADAAVTNATGLFFAYVGRPVDFIVSASGYKSETVRMGSTDLPSTALIVLTKL